MPACHAFECRAGGACYPPTVQYISKSVVLGGVYRRWPAGRAGLLVAFGWVQFRRSWKNDSLNAFSPYIHSFSILHSKMVAMPPLRDSLAEAETRADIWVKGKDNAYLAQYPAPIIDGG
jgi:hypothetical protein